MSKQTPSQGPKSSEFDEHGPISGSVLELLALFDEALPEVAFPGVDAASLAALATRVRTQTERTAAALSELEAARAELSGARSELRDAAKRALGYAKVYAEGDPELSERVKAIKLSERKLAPPSRRPRKKRKSKSDVPSIHVV